MPEQKLIEKLEAKVERLEAALDNFAVRLRRVQRRRSIKAVPDIADDIEELLKDVEGSPVPESRERVVLRSVAAKLRSFLPTNSLDVEPWDITWVGSLTEVLNEAEAALRGDRQTCCERSPYIRRAARKEAEAALIERKDEK